MPKAAAPALSVASPLAAFAQINPVGTWRSIDDKTQEIKSAIATADNGGVLTGRIAKLLGKDAQQDAVCDLCTDDRKDKPILGMEIIRGAKKQEGKEVWEKDKLLDPENGKTHALCLTPIEAGKKLDVRGSVFGIGRTQTWVRVQ